MLPELQTAIRRALLGGEDATVLARLHGDRIAAADRFAAYRTNVLASLVGVLEAAFPAVAAHAGKANFRYAASLFAKARPPREARLLAYGAGFPDWLAAFGPAQAKPWLAPLARLEWLRNEALFAADAEPLEAAALAAVAPEQVAGLRLSLHPSLRLLCADYPVGDLWAAAQAAAVEEGGTPPEAPLDAGPQCLLVQRPHLVVQQFILPAGEAALLRALGGGATLAAAAEAALVATPDLDLQRSLFGLLTRGCFVTATAADLTLP